MPSQRVNIVADVQGFQDSEYKLFIIKDVAFIAYTGDCNVIATFSARVASPKPFRDVLCSKTRKSAMWLTRFFHGLHWDDPGITYKDMLTSLQIFDNYDATIFVKGAEKTTWMRRIFKYADIQDLELYECPALYKLKNSVKKTFICAYDNVKLLISWIEANKFKFH